MAGDVTISDRIGCALRPDAPCQTIEAALAAVADEVARIEQRRDALRQTALSPTTSPAEARKARTAAEDAGFEAERMKAAADQLAVALDAARARDAVEARRAAYDAAVVERDALVGELRSTYPDLAGRLADLLGRIEANAASVRAVNAERPDDAPPLMDVEAVARGVTSAGLIAADGSHLVGQAPLLVNAIRLPHLDGRDAAADTGGFWGRRDMMRWS